jgi:hypothetical protein
MSPNVHIAIATCHPVHPFAEAEHEALRAAFASYGLSAAPVAWDDPHVHWESFRACVVRSTWDYFQRYDEFLAWVRRADRATRLWNPAPVLRWNTNKRYLCQLEALGVPVAPTAWVEAGAAFSLASLLTRPGWDDLVVKPAVSAGADRTRRVTPSSEAGGQRHLDDILRGGEAMLQPYQHGIDAHGERSLFFIDGQLTHAVRRQPALTAGATAPSEKTVATAREIELARSALVAVDSILGPQKLLYARVDFVESPFGPVLMELELTEPSLFVHHHAAVADALAEAVVRRLNSSP